MPTKVLWNMLHVQKGEKEKETEAVICNKK